LKQELEEKDDALDCLKLREHEFKKQLQQARSMLETESTRSQLDQKGMHNAFSK